MRKIQSSLMTRGMLLLAGIVFSAFSIAQVTVKGRVTDEKGNSVSNVTVTVMNTTIGTTTDVSGNYELTNTSLKPGSYSLVTSGVGYKEQTITFTLANENVLTVNITLRSDALGLDEVVVVGSSLTATRKQLGNTINSVTGRQLQNSGSGNIGAALQGKVAGAQITQTSGDPAGAISIRMRGTSTISGSTEPLYVIDGVIMSNATANVTNLNINAGGTSAIGTNRMADINPNDIEKLDVIPGAAAAAIYGSQASNGVVLITTKKGKAGQVKVDFSTTFGFNELREKVYITTYGKQFGSAALRLGNISNFTGGPTLTYTRPDGAVRNLASSLVDVTRFDWQDQVFQRGLMTDNYISMSGGSEKTRYVFSGGFLKNEGIIRNTDFRRFNFKARIDQQVSKYLSVSAGIMYSNSLSNEKPNGNSFWSPINSVNISNNIYNIKDRDAAGNLKAVEPTRVNPLSIIEETDITQQINRTLTDLQIKIKPTKNLSIDYTLGVDAYSQEGRNYIKPYPYSGVNVAFFDKGYASSALVNSFFINNDLNINYQAKFSKFTSVTTVGFNQQTQKITGNFTEGRDLLTGISTVNGAAVQFPQRYSLDQKIIYGAFAQQTLGYNNLAYITLAARVDGSTVFDESKRRYIYPKASGSLVVSDLDFWGNSRMSAWFNTLKVRASWGLAGNLSGIGPYSRFTNYTSNFVNGQATYNINTALGNQFIEPERSSEIEMGADLGFLNNRLGVGFTWYNKKIVDGSLLVFRTLAPSSGGSSRVENVGNMTNKGWELLLTAVPVKTKNFSWTSVSTVSRNINKVTGTTQALIALDNPTGAPSFIIPGESVGVFFGGYFERDANNNLKLDPSGRPIQAVVASTKAPLRKVIGNPNPDWIISFNNSFEYKQFAFSFLFDGALGQEVFNADKRTRQGVGIGDWAEKEAKGEIPRGYIFSIYGAEEWRIDDGSFVKLREVALSYRLPSFAKFIKSSSITLTGRNLFSFDNYNGYDPETNSGGNSTVLRGIDFGNVPIPRSYQITLRASF
jgi:TonB-linked SusC/RagA family outer membrane protein